MAAKSSFEVNSPTTTSIASLGGRTVVCNCKVKFLRPQYKNLEDWCKDPFNVYIGRAGVVFVNGQRFPKHCSVWANPYKIGKDGSREDVILKYRTYIRKKIVEDPLNYCLDDLRGKRLGCWCISNDQGTTTSLLPAECHGQVLLDLLS